MTLRTRCGLLFPGMQWGQGEGDLPPNTLVGSWEWRQGALHAICFQRPVTGLKAMTSSADWPHVQLNAVLATSQALLTAAKDVRSALLLVWYSALSGIC